MYSFLMQQRTIYIAWIGNYITKEYMICGCFINYLPVGKALVMVKNKHGYGRSLNTEDKAIGHKVLVYLSQVYLSKGIDTNYWRPTCYFIVGWHLPLSYVPFTVRIILYECINSFAIYDNYISVERCDLYT